MSTTKQEFESIEGQSPDIFRRADGTIVKVVPIAHPATPAGAATAAPAAPAAPPPPPPPPAARSKIEVWDELRRANPMAAAGYFDRHRVEISRAIDARRKAGK